ncbi:MAG: carbon-nitrogen hydrolase family protein [Planctomycetales bacterium]|nr:carbon-nitrogen hydrolase family protein [Planctomycetales bacterium]
MKLAGVQFDVQLMQVADNLRRMVEFVEHTAAEGATLTIFPECSLTGYCFESHAEALPYAEPIPGPATESMTRVCTKTNSFVVMGMLEVVDTQLFNAAVLVGPQGVIGSYRKAHLPFLGVDRFNTPGDRPFAVHAVNADLRVGMNICYDGSFPEAARCLMLLGADVIALPTNWPPGAECVAEALIRARALENGLYFAAVNRVGTERGIPFIGQSQVADPSGKLVHLASADREEVFFAEIDPERSRRKKVVRIPGVHEIDRLADRRPELYGPIVASRLES